MKGHGICATGFHGLLLCDSVLLYMQSYTDHSQSISY